MALSVDGRTPSILQQNQTAKDSLKFAGIDKTFNIISEVPSSDLVATDEDVQYDAQISDTLNTMKALQIARKSLSDVQSIAKDIKSSYKTEKNDAFAPLDDSMLRQRYEATKQIRNILENAKLNHKNVFTLDYAKEGVTLDLSRKSMNDLNLRDELSINIFSDNIERLSKQIEDNIQKLQGKIDKINQSRWLSMENLRNVRLEKKEVNAALKSANQTPSLAAALAQITQQTQATNNQDTTNSANIAAPASTTLESNQDSKEGAIVQQNAAEGSESEVSPVHARAMQNGTEASEEAAQGAPIEAILEYKSQPAPTDINSNENANENNAAKPQELDATSQDGTDGKASEDSQVNTDSKEGAEAKANEDSQGEATSQKSETTQESNNTEALSANTTAESTQESKADTTAENVNASDVHASNASVNNEDGGSNPPPA